MRFLVMWTKGIKLVKYFRLMSFEIFFFYKNNNLLRSKTPFKSREWMIVTQKKILHIPSFQPVAESFRRWIQYECTWRFTNYGSQCCGVLYFQHRHQLRPVNHHLESCLNNLYFSLRPSLSSKLCGSVCAPFLRMTVYHKFLVPFGFSYFFFLLSKSSTVVGTKNMDYIFSPGSNIKGIVLIAMVWKG